MSEFTQPAPQPMPEPAELETSFQHSYLENLEILKPKGELGELFSALYQKAVEIEPELSEVAIHTKGVADDPILQFTGGYAIHKGRTYSGRYEIIINTDDGVEHYEKLLNDRKESVAHNAEMLGIPVESFDAKTLAGFIFLHELGHIVDYMKNAPDLQDCINRREHDMDTLPKPKYNPVELLQYLNTDDGKFWFTETKTTLKQNFGVSSPQELCALQGKRYRLLETENIPDKFAVQVIRPFS